ncbi:MAG: hypothetical protein R2939_23135, partial [Kofleriaceae bacterium]
MAHLRRLLLLGLVLAAPGCGAALGHVETSAPLGRVVIYRSGVAFYERRAIVLDGQLQVRVPRDRIDDFLKSMTVVDVATGERLAVTVPRRQHLVDDVLDLEVQTARDRPTEVVLTYVTAAAAWKPSYRIAVTGDDAVHLEGWAIVDNTSGEDWRGVQVGVGASSALSFRYDLWSVRDVDRELVGDATARSYAPPTAVSPTGGAADEEAAPEVVAWFDAGGYGYDGAVPVPERTFEQALAVAAGADGDGLGVSFSGTSSLENRYIVDAHPLDETTTGEDTWPFRWTSTTDSRSTDGASRGEPTQASHRVTLDTEYLRNTPGASRERAGGRSSGDAAPRRDYRQFDALVERLRREGGGLVIEANIAGAVVDVVDRARARARSVRNQLIDAGLAPARVEIVETASTGGAAQLRLVRRDAPIAAEVGSGGGRTTDGAGAPVGESHFLAPRPMDVPAAT